MKWINFLHLYQPPKQTKEIVDLVSQESYRLIIDLLKKYPNLNLTLNISGSLLELLERYGHNDLIQEFKSFVEKNRIELVGSAMYHPILPLLPPDLIRRQIELQQEAAKKYFGNNYAPKGFYLPEMAYSKAVADIISELGFEWIILDEIHAQSEKIEPQYKYKIKDHDLGVIFRDHKISRTFPPQYVLENIDIKNTDYLITAHDGELYGHWHKEDHGFYQKAFENSDITFIKASEYRDSLTQTKEIENSDANWESTPEELAAGNPFALWNDRENPIQKNLWDFANFVISTINANSNDQHIKGATMHLDKGLASCSWWWASSRKLGSFSPVSWNPEEVEKGASELLAATRTLKSLQPELRIKAEKLFTDLHHEIWTKHWANHSPSNN